MRPFADDRNQRLVANITPLIGLAGTLAGMLFSFHRIGAGQPPWKAALEAVALGQGVTAIGILGLTLMVWRHRR
jgi:biopolymer transport protein ExbB/TolQ